MQPLHARIHPRFKLNGISLTFDKLSEVSDALINEGESFEQSIGVFLSSWIEHHTTLEVKTSGSTGDPKTIILEKEHMVNSALATGTFFNLKPGDSALLCLSSDYIAGKMMLVRAMILGLELNVVPPSSYPLKDISKTYDFCAMVPLQLETSLEQIHRIKKLIVGGAPISKNLRKKVQNKDVQVFETYGMTETITHIAIKKVNNLGLNETKANFETLPDVNISTDERDCLIINAPAVNPRTIVTNDIVRVVSNTQFEWLGRYDNVINSGGVKIVPERIEGLLEPLIDNRFIIIGVPDEQLGQKIVLVLEGEGDKINLLNKLRDIKGLKKYEVPKEILFTTNFKETKNGKISRKKTLQQIIG